MNFHREIWRNYPYSLSRKNLGDDNGDLPLFCYIQTEPEGVWGNVREKTEEEILLSKSIENWKAGKTEEGAGQLEEYYEKMAVKLAAIHNGRD